MAPAEQAALVHTPEGNELLDPEADLKVDNRRKQSNRDKRAAKGSRYMGIFPPKPPPISIGTTVI